MSTQTNTPPPDHDVKYEDLPVLDLRRHPPEAVGRIRKIEDVAVVLLSESNAASLTAKIEDVASVLTLPDDEDLTVVAHSGQVEISGLAMASDAATRQILVASGQVTVTPPITECRYRQIHASGQLLIPESGRAAITTALTTMNGQMSTYRDDLPLRTINGSAELDAEFLTLIDRPECLVVNGSLELADDVTGELLRAKVGQIVLNGSLSVPKQVAAVARFLAPQQNGAITVRE
jgi:hypothetical protein